MNLLLDTCAIIWTASDAAQLSAAAREAVMNPDSRLFVSAVSCAEVACLCERGRIRVEPHWRTWFDRVLDSNGWPALPADLAVVQEAYALPEAFHRDPCDRIIVATARIHDLHVVTADRRILDYPHVRSLW